MTTSAPQESGLEGKTIVNVAEAASTGNTYKYKNFGSVAVTIPNVGDNATDYVVLPADGLIMASRDDKIAVIEVDGGGGIVRFGQAVATSADIVAINENFESGILAGANWIATSGTSGIVSGVQGVAGKVYKVQVPGGTSSLSRWFTNALFQDRKTAVTAQMKVMMDNMNGDKSIYLSKADDANGTNRKDYVYLVLQTDGSLVAKKGNSDGTDRVLLDSGSLVSDRWYAIRVDVTVSSGKYSVYVDDELAGSVIARNSSSATEITYFQAKSTLGSAINLDDLIIFQAIPPSGLSAVPTFEAASYYLPYGNSEAQVNVYYKKKDTVEWKKAFTPYYSNDDHQFRGSIVYLSENTDYDMKADIIENGIQTDSQQATFKTWTSEVPIAQVIPVSQLHNSGSGPLIIDKQLSGTATGWIKIIGDGTTVIDAGNASESAVSVKNTKYIILENLKVKGGKLNGFEINQAESIRIINNEVYGWGRAGVINLEKGDYYDETGAPIDFDSGIKVFDSSKIVVERNYVHDPRGQTNAWSGDTWANTHPHGPTAINVKGGTGKGGIVVRYNDLIGSDDHRWNDAITGGAFNGYTYAGLSRDGDIYGNMLAFGQDDGTELDGGAMNVRYYNNKIEGFYSAISTAPNMQGPTYLFRNLVTNLGDSYNKVSSMVKAGGGSTYSKGRQYYFNNTVFTRGQGINGIGYGSDADRTLFYATSRNNVIVNTRYSKDSAIKDNQMLNTNDFDYDVLGNRAYTNGLPKVIYSEGQEAHGQFGLPLFMNIANADFRLSAGSLGINSGSVLDNFADSYTGTTPDAGAWEQGDSAPLPARPIPLKADKYQVNLNGTEAQSVTVTVGTLKENSMNYRIRKNEANDWLTIVTPDSGTLTSDTTLTLTLQADRTKFRRHLEKSVVLVRLDNGYSLPITVYADQTPPITDLEITGNRINASTDPIAIYNSDLVLSMFANNESLSYIKYEYSLDGGAHWGAYNGQLTFTEDKNYTLMYRAIDASGNVEAARTFSFIVEHMGQQHNMLAAPANLTALSDDGHITLGWSSVTGATYYHIYQGVTAGVYDSTPAATVTSTTYTLSGLMNNHVYFYTIKAVNAADLSPFSNEVSVTPQTVFEWTRRVNRVNGGVKGHFEVLPVLSANVEFDF
ncbi:hypothetical protein [Paenibacillus sp. 1_12]|uniref:BACON domain-containing protein n=1 Tax=Paenibacillus sp. 1_12 TaxID=1566278 RepID=UPI0035291526